MSPTIDPQALLRQLFAIAVDAVRPSRCMPPVLRELQLPGRLVVLGAGKAAAEMAAVAEACLGPERLAGLAVTRYGHGAPTSRIEVIEAAHPVPDASGVMAARRILQMASQAGAADTVLCLLSGGGSALLALPAPGITLADKQALTQALLASGAPIEEINCVRKHLSAIKGGRLAASAWPARLITLAISDVVGDAPTVIASGPTVGDPTTSEQALEILARRKLQAPASVITHLQSRQSETPKPGDPCFEGTDYQILARAADALAAAAQAARAAGITPILLGDGIQGEARDVAQAHARLARDYGAVRPALLLSGGELTITHHGRGGSGGAGGRNQEYALALVLALDGAPGIHALACDTDGADGQAGAGPEAAGASIGPDTLARARAAGLIAQDFLDRHDSYAFFRALDGLVVCGPTRTNVNDFRAILMV